MAIRRLYEQWDNFWFAERSPAPICLYRICYGLLALISGLLLSTDLLTFFGPRGVITSATMQEYWQDARFSLFFLLPQTDQTVIILYVLLLISALFVTVGLFTRTSLIALFLLMISFHHRDFFILHSGDSLLRINGFILIFSPAGEMFSLDRLKRKRAGIAPADPWQSTASVWTARLLQLQLAAVYWQTFFAKLIGTSWLNGTAVYFASRLEMYTRFPLPFLLDHLITIKLLTWGTLALELALWTLVWFKKFRYPVLIMGVMFHLGLDWVFNIPLFEYEMITAYLSFVEPEDIKRACQYVSARIKQSSLYCAAARSAPVDQKSSL